MNKIWLGLVKTTWNSFSSAWSIIIIIIIIIKCIFIAQNRVIQLMR